MAERSVWPVQASATMRYYITNRKLGWWVHEAVAAGVDFIQVREKDLNTRELVALVRNVVSLAAGSQTRVLVNSRADVALVSGAQGVHLPAGSPAPSVYRRSWPELLIAVSCHDAGEVRDAESEGADFVVFGPVFDSPGKGAPLGLDMLRLACAAVEIPVFALGGVDESKVPACVAAGARGVAGIRMFGP